MDAQQPPAPNRRGSLSLSQTLSLDWTPPPPADLEQIHASSSQAPGLTSFSLGSPPGGGTEQLSFNRIYSRVKNFAGAVRDAVGAPSSSSIPNSPTKSVLSGGVGSDQYYQQGASRDSFLSIATSDDGTESQLSPAKSPILTKGHLRQHSISSLQSRASSRVSSNGSVAGADYAQPTALRKVNQLAATPRPTGNPSVAQVTVFRGGAESLRDGGASSNVSHNGSVNSLRDVGGGVGGSGPSTTATVGAFVGAVGNVIGPTVGFGSAASGSGARTTESGGGRAGDKPFVGAGDDSDDSASDGTPSDSSDDDVVMLHSKLPAGSAGGRQRLSGKTKTGKGPGPRSRPQPSTSIANKAAKPEFQDRLHLPPSPVTPDSATAPGPNMLTPSEPIVPGHITPPPPASAKANSNLPQLSALNLQSKASDRINPRSASAAPGLRRDAMVRKRRSPADQILLLPGLRITGDRSSDADSSPATTSMTATENKGEATSSVYRQGGFGDGKMVNGAHGGGITGSTEAVSQALRQLRMGNLTRDFWMKDEVCKDCFLCGNTFSAWRRKHHCRESPPSEMSPRGLLVLSRIQDCAVRSSVRSAPP